MARPYRCVVPGCERTFEKSHGAMVHFHRSHKKLGKWKPEWRELLESRQQLPFLPATLPSLPATSQKRKPKRQQRGSSASFMEGIVQALRGSSTLQLSVPEIMTRLRQSGVKSKSRDALRTRISAEVRHHPESGVSRVERGVYKLVKDAADRLSPDPTEPTEVPEEVFDVQGAAAEILSLRRMAREERERRQRQVEAIMGLSRIIVSLVSD